MWSLARPLVLDAARVKENWFSLSFIADPCCQTGPRASTGKSCRFSGGFGLAPMALAGGRGATARQCAKSGAVLRRAGHEKAGAKQKPGSKLPWKRVVLSRLAHSRSPGWGRRRHRARRCRARRRPAGTGQRAGQLMRLSYSHPVLLHCPAERMPSAIICNAQYDNLDSAEKPSITF
jgi:hypothetical protein